MVLADLPPVLDVSDSVRLILIFDRPNRRARPAYLDFPAIAGAMGPWLMPMVTFSAVTRTKYQPGGGITADGIVVGSLPVSVCRKLGHTHP